jgi:hypothetical protein
VAFVILAARSATLRPMPKGDAWYASDTLPYESDNPRDVQRKIDALRNKQGSAEN